MTDSQHSNIRSGNGELTNFPKMVFGVMGSTGGDVPESARAKIFLLGAEVGRRGYTLITGVAPGLPHDSVLGAKSQGGLVSIPHPFDKVRRSVITDDALEEVLPHADIIEAFNARNVFRGADERARAAASTHGLVMTAVSDAHHALELGRTYTEMPEFDGSSAGFLAALKDASLHPSPPPWWGQVLMHGVTTFNKGLRRVAPWTRQG